ncbi:acyl CoA:acetate/3-ketoacid CoA transferase [Variovorax sp. KK3]|uniref:acyl CoA:acetate/3-ketoacid CoA transferase n=1 Tax=Variovorax sp. KK3 TaxID=1855728 RepID=UPI00097C9A29|nr:CoA-transferase [Variovorax sp. KK3]
MKILAPTELQQVLTELAPASTVAVSGAGGGLLEPEDVLAAFERAFLDTGAPNALTLVHSLGMGNRSDKGINRFAHEGMVRRVIGGHWIWSPAMLELAQRNRIEAYCLPSGALTHLLREIGAGRPGLFTHVGLGTFVDPRQQGGRCNAAATEALVELMQVDGQDVLRYRPFPVDVAVLRGTFADENGNISAVEEPADLDSYAVALAAKRGGGIVIAQVREVVPAGQLRPREVSVPGNLVDYVLVSPDQPQTYHGAYDLRLAGLQGQLDSSSAALPPAPHDPVRQVVALRAAEELIDGASVNFGFGMSSGVAEVIARRGDTGRYWFTIEQGIHGGQLLTGDMFGIAAEPAAILSAADQFDLYSGGGLDQTFLGMAEMDAQGNVNVSHFGGQVSGPGGFIDISQGARKVVFCGAFDAKGSRLAARGGRLAIESHGTVRKLVRQVSGITFSGPEAVRRGQEVVYVTERAVFRLTPEGVELIEIAPGVDLQRDVLDHMDFAPIVRDPKQMSAAYFNEATADADIDAAAVA